MHQGLDIEMVYLGDKKYKCYNCDFKTGLKGDLSKHICKVHDGKQNWRCDICNESFKKKVDLQVHKRIRHDTISEVSA